MMTKRTFLGSASLAFTLSTILWTAASEAKCYSRAAGNVISGGWIPCANTALSVGGAQACCMAGSLCGEDSLCHTPSDLNAGNSNWYPSGCTDPTYQDPVCRLSCTTNYPTYAIYNTSSDLWNCCGAGGCNGTVTGETFSAIAPSKWAAVPTTATNSYDVAATVAVPKPTSTSTGSSAMSSAASSPASIATSTPTARSHSGLSAGAQAGIGVGIGLLAVAIIAAAIFLLRRRRGAHARRPSGLPGYDDAMAGQHGAAKYAPDVQTSELPNSAVYSNELEARSVPQELATESLKGYKT